MIPFNRLSSFLLFVLSLNFLTCALPASQRWLQVGGVWQGVTRYQRDLRGICSTELPLVGMGGTGPKCLVIALKSCSICW